jgi:hypothetical protein
MAGRNTFVKVPNFDKGVGQERVYWAIVYSTNNETLRFFPSLTVPSVFPLRLKRAANGRERFRGD